MVNRKTKSNLDILSNSEKKNVKMNVWSSYVYYDLQDGMFFCFDLFKNTFIHAYNIFCFLISEFKFI